ncbi:MAG: hypothetical protein HRT71_07760 [Flavobacteriales bacterium]|nr:hypothetical protein [Flavobacteriales bacterium]
MIELFDEDGNEILKDKSNQLNVSDLPKGTYYLNYGNEMEEIKIKNKQ